jgi:hypothetical protein
MQAKSHIGIRANALLTDTGYSLAGIGYWKGVIIILAAAFLILLLITQFGKANRLEKGAEVAFSRARQLLHEADKENRNVRPLPLSLAQIEARFKLT